MLLQHIHFPSATPILYTHALHIQEIFARQHLTHKALVSASRHESTPSQPATPSAPYPKLLTFTSEPTYTTGLRDSKSLTPAQLTHLTATGARHHASSRGGLTTYHGPGQLTAFLISTLSAHDLTPRCYVHFLEDAVIETAAAYGVRARRWSASMLDVDSTQHLEDNIRNADTNDLPDETRPGVWTTRSSKLCSAGIHFRRGVSSYGVGFNVLDDVKPWFDRIVACGIPDSRAVSLQGERGRAGVTEGDEVFSSDRVADTLARVVARRLESVDAVMSVDPRELGDLD